MLQSSSSPHVNLQQGLRPQHQQQLVLGWLGGSWTFTKPSNIPCKFTLVANWLTLSISVVTVWSWLSLVLMGCVGSGSWLEEWSELSHKFLGESAHLWIHIFHDLLLQSLPAASILWCVEGNLWLIYWGTCYFSLGVSILCIQQECLKKQNLHPAYAAHQPSGPGPGDLHMVSTTAVLTGMQLSSCNLGMNDCTESLGFYVKQTKKKQP